MKVSELTYDYLLSVGLPKTFMHTDRSDSLRQMANEFQLEKAKSDLIAAYGDVEISVHPDADWFDQIKIEDEKWQSDNENYRNEKAEWCNKYGCD
ncbi:MAG: hypothetical protein J6W09_11345 [Bacteroidales bacterium]|nr:hypothetical protein [Bacteroidales bacterium]